jgi:hypothetical protein
MVNETLPPSRIVGHVSDSWSAAPLLCRGLFRRLDRLDLKAENNAGVG